MDQIIKQEEIGTAFPAILDRLGLPVPTELPRALSDLRLSRRPAREVLSEAHRRMIYENCRETFDDLGYEP